MTDTDMTHTCPRRMSGWGPWERTENLDTYTSGHGLIGQARGCSFCGSMHPDDFLAAVRSAAKIGPTDKSYKLYVHTPNPEPDRVYAIAATTSEQRPSDSLTLHYLAWDEMDDEHREAAAGHDPTTFPFIGFGPRPTIDGKFYTAHLSPEQGRTFYDLWQSGKVSWGYPGHPYVPLYLPGFASEPTPP